MTLQNAPQVLFRNTPPLELEGVPGVKHASEGEMSYVTFGEIASMQQCAARTNAI